MPSFFHSLTIKQANIFTMLFILLFTVIFADLLITENYREYEKNLQKVQTVDLHTELLSHHEAREKQLKTLLIKNTITIATLAFIIFTVMIGIFKIFNMLLQRDIDSFLEFFKSSAYEHKILNPQSIYFSEFKKMVHYANEMTKVINEQKKDLQELNLSLEEKVKAKTADLLLSNKKLQEEKQFSEDILHSQKEFLRHTIHETNTPLSVMLTSIELLSMQGEKNRHLSKIEAAAKNLFNIYDDLSYLVKKEHIHYPRIALNLSQYLSSRIEFFSEVAALSGLCFEYESNAQECFIYMNETKLQRVIDNTLTNAIKYTLAQQSIVVNLMALGTFVEVSVASRSKEIEDKERVFEAFYREVKSDDGFGIGLRLVKSICDEEGIAISLDSSNERTVFTYRFKMMGY